MDWKKILLTTVVVALPGGMFVAAGYLMYKRLRKKNDVSNEDSQRGPDKTEVKDAS